MYDVFLVWTLWLETDITLWILLGFFFCSLWSELGYGM